MSESELRDLLRDRVDEVGGPDLVAGAWARGRAVRRRRAALAVGGVALATAVAAVGVSGLRAADEDARPGPADTSQAPPQVSDPAPTADVEPYDGAGARPDARLAGDPVYWAPDPAQEADLAPTTVDRPALPAEIDLSTEAPSDRSDPLPYAEAAFGVIDGDRARVLLVNGDEYRSVDVSAIAPFPFVSNPAAPPAVGEQLLAPGGDYLQFPQGDHLMVFDIADGEWRRVDTGSADTSNARWLNDESVFLPAVEGGPGPSYSAETGQRDGGARLGARDPLADLGDAPRYEGRDRDGAYGAAQSWVAATSVLGPDGAVHDPHVLVAPGAGGPQVLLCGADHPCPVASWSASDTIVYESRGAESRGAESRLVAWRLGSHDFTVLSTITGLADGERWVGSYARWWLRYGHPERNTSPD